MYSPEIKTKLIQQLTIATTNIVNPKQSAILTKFADPLKLTTAAQPKKFSRRLPKNSANRALHMLLFSDLSSSIPKASENFPISYTLQRRTLN